MITTRPATPADAEAIARVHRAAFPKDNEAKLVGELDRQGYSEVSVVAEKDGEVVGHVLFSRMTLMFDDRTVRTLALAPVAVLPENQNDGIGAKLIRDGLGRAASAGWEAVIVLGHAKYYPRFGFDPAAVKHIASPYKSPNLMGLELKAGALRGQGGKMLYPPPFGAG
jgi:putative acetyltransferase